MDLLDFAGVGEMSSDRNDFHLSIASQFENIDLVQEVLGDALERLGAGEDYRHQADLAVREAVANAIKHGNSEEPDRTVRIDFGVEGDEVVIRVRDDGEGFEPSQVADPMSRENLLKPGGRGILYMRTCMDTVHHRRHPEGGTEVEMRKRLAPVEKETEEPHRELKEEK